MKNRPYLIASAALVAIAVLTVLTLNLNKSSKAELDSSMAQFDYSPKITIKR